MTFFSEEIVESTVSNCDCDTYGCQDGQGGNTGCDNDNEGNS